MNVLVLNAGSATLKYALYSMPDEHVLTQRRVDHPGGAGLLEAAQQAIEECRSFGIDAIGHRVVHGGWLFTQPTQMTHETLTQLRGLKTLDPLHNPAETALVEAGIKAFPDVPSVAVFDTAFHQTMPETAWRYALPRAWADQFHLRRYGFHGISYQYVSGRLLSRLGRKPAGSRLIICHLGSGASVCALRDGNSVETSMGLTPLEGLAMGTRCGDIDPGLLLYLLRSQGMTAANLENLLNKQSGLAGLSGGVSDMRELEQAIKRGDTGTNLAVDIFCSRIRKYIGAYAAVLGGLDAVAFTGGIGEHSTLVRERVCANLDLLGLQVDADRNNGTKDGEREIGAHHSAAAIWVIPTDEERQIAREVFALLQG